MRYCLCSSGPRVVTGSLRGCPEVATIQLQAVTGVRNVLLLLSFSVVLNPAAAPPARMYVHPDCGYSFRVPSGSRGKAVTDDPQGHCEVVVRPNGNDRDDVAVWVEGGKGDFQAGAQAANLGVVTEPIRSKVRTPQPPLGAYIGLQADGSSKKARHFTP